MYPFESAAFAVEQPFGRFVVATVPAHILLDTAYSDRLTAIRSENGTYRLSGSQRALAVAANSKTSVNSSTQAPHVFQT